MAIRPTETRIMKKACLVLLLMLSVILPVLADDAQSKAVALQSLRTRKDLLELTMIERFVTVKASPEVIAVMESESVFGQYSYANFFAGRA